MAHICCIIIIIIIISLFVARILLAFSITLLFLAEVISVFFIFLVGELQVWFLDVAFLPYQERFCTKFINNMAESKASWLPYVISLLNEGKKGHVAYYRLMFQQILSYHNQLLLL